ncbi:zinc finger protein AEBP2-like [Amphiura filiformis]|uniref:zinc finger protein AEBP2-like n=1 Tax=Amphiura filiformis TaxID=82378 RepID=UPI003B2215E7
MPSSNSSVDSSNTPTPQTTESSNTPTPQPSGSTTPTSQKKRDYTCRWESCGHEAQTSADLAEHVSTVHAQKQVDKQAEKGADKSVKKFVCLWDGCKVYNTPSSSRTWLMKHILDHCGDKPFRCVFGGCTLSFRTQGGLIRHVQSHLSEQPQQKTPRSKDDSPGKVLKKKRLRVKRRLSVVKTDDFFDSRIMDAVHHHLVSLDAKTKVDSQGKGSSVICQSKVTGRRVEKNGEIKLLLHWTPEDVLPDRWIPESQLDEFSTCTVPLSTLSMEKMGQLQPGLTQASRRKRTRRK